MDKEFLGNFKIIRKVGEGGMAVAYLAHHKEIPDHRVILKQLKDPRHGEKFKKEANNLAKLNDHHNICRIYDYFNDGDRTIIVMEYIEGATLKDVIESEERLPMNLFLKLGVDLLRIIKYAHDRKMYHRDIKPGNIMVDKQGEVKVIDFGIAKDATDPSETAAGVFSGTPLFAPIEQFNPLGHIDWAKTDIYALGTTLYLMVTGRMPFDGQDWEEYAENKRLAEPYSPSTFNPEVSKKLDEIILKSIARLPQDRYNSLGEMVGEFEQLRTEKVLKPSEMDKTVDVSHYPGVTQASESSARWGKTPQPEPSKKNRRAMIITIVALLAVTPVGLYLYFGTSLLLGTMESSPPANTADSIGSSSVQPQSASIIPVKGRLEIIASPSADFYVDDSLIGSNLSSKTIELDGGDYQIRLENGKARTKSQLRTVSVLPGQISKMDFQFDVPSQPAFGSIEFKISPGGDIYIDDNKVAANQSNFTFSAAPGNHDLKVVNSSTEYDSTITDRIKLAESENKSLNYTFRKKPTNGFVRVGSWPPKASVYINDKLQAQPTPFTFMLPAGSYNIRVWLQTEDASRESTLVVVPGDTVKFAPEFQ